MNVKHKIFSIGILSILILVCPARIIPRPESIRIGPSFHDSNLGSGGIHYLGSSTRALVTDVEVSFTFTIFHRPTEFAVLASSSIGLEDGLNVTIDKYGNMYLLVESVGNDSYQLMFLSKPLPLNTTHNLQIEIHQNQGQLLASVDGKKVPVNEARPGKAFDIDQLMLRTDAFSLGGLEDHEFQGVITNAYFVAGSVLNVIDTRSLKLIAVLAMLVLISSIFQDFRSTLIHKRALSV